MIRGLVSIGTNSTRAIVARIGAGAPVVDLARSVGTRIGEGLKERGHLDETAMQRTLDAIAEHAAAIREHTPDFEIIATSALRRADNEAAFDERVHALTGRRIHIISGEEEARCSYAGAVSGIDAAPEERLAVLDVGGGSSEYAVGTKNACERVVSCEIGAVRITEAFTQLSGTGGAVGGEVLDGARSYAKEQLKPALAFDRVQRLVLVGGSATTAIGLLRGKRELFEYAEISARAIDGLIAELSELPLDARKALAGMNPQRADILLGGLLIVRELMRETAQERALVSTRDVLLGYLLRHPSDRQ